MTKYVIRSEWNTFVPDTVNFLRDVWTEDINEAKVFSTTEEAFDTLEDITEYFKSRGWSISNMNVYVITEENTRRVTLGSQVCSDDKETVLWLLNCIKDWGVRECDKPDMDRIITYVKVKGT